MKAFLNRLNRGLSKEPKDKDKDKDREKDKDKDKDKDSLVARDRSDTNTLGSSTNSNPHSPSREKRELIQLPPLPEWPPPSARAENPLSHVPSISPAQIQRSVSAGTTGTHTGTPSSIASIKPLPDLSTRPLPPIEEPNDADNDSGVGLPVSSPVPHTADPSEPPSKSAARKVAETAANSEIQKKVAFISPPPTPSGPSTSQPLPDATPSPTISGSPQAPAAVPLKTTVSRFQAAHGKDTRGSTSIAASSSRTDLGKQTTTSTPTSVPASLSPTSVQTSRATSTRTVTSPYPGSMRSGTPYSQMSNTSTRILAVTSWSESAEEDLVSNLGPRERTRQEVLWEIVASEERYVSSLLPAHPSIVT